MSKALASLMGLTIACCLDVAAVAQQVLPSGRPLEALRLQPVGPSAPKEHFEMQRPPSSSGSVARSTPDNEARRAVAAALAGRGWNLQVGDPGNMPPAIGGGPSLPGSAGSR